MSPSSTTSPVSTTHSPTPASSPQNTSHRITAQRNDPTPQRSARCAQRSAPPPQSVIPASGKIAPASSACDDSEEKGLLSDEILGRMMAESKATLQQSLDESLKALDISKAELRRSLSPVSNISPQQAAIHNVKGLFEFSPSPSVASVSSQPISSLVARFIKICLTRVSQANHNLSILSVLEQEEEQEGGDANEQDSRTLNAVAAKVTPPGARPRHVAPSSVSL